MDNLDYLDEFFKLDISEVREELANLLLDMFLAQFLYPMLGSQGIEQVYNSESGLLYIFPWICASNIFP